MLPGFPGDALVAGERSVLFWAAAEDQRREIISAVIQDAGHSVTDAPEALRRLADSLAQAVLIQGSSFQRIVEAGGPMTSSDRARRAFDVWVKATQAVERHARALSLERVPRATVDIARQQSGLERA